MLRNPEAPIRALNEVIPVGMAVCPSDDKDTLCKARHHGRDRRAAHAQSRETGLAED